MTLAALAQSIHDALVGTADSVNEEKERHRIVYKAAVGKQMFVVTCEEMAPDREDPPST